MPTTRVLVLGPVRVTRDGEELVPGGPRERGVLAALALAGGGGLDHDRLVDLVWGYGAPRTAHRTAQAYLSRLRTLLGGDAIVTSAGRHRLTGVEVDLWEFERLVTSARRTPATASRDLAEALALWRDRTVAQDAAIDGAAELQQAWERSRLDAAELSLVHLSDDEVVGVAQELLAESPHRERAWSALATAYYRAGRQDEALAAIRAARRRLADDLGVDLSPELEQLEADLLHHRVAAGAPPAIAEPMTRLVGREDALDQVASALERSRLVTLVGTGGIGKTRLALAMAERVSGTGSTPVFLARLATATSTVAVRDALVEALDAGVPDLEQAARRRFERVPGLLVVDNCEHVLPTAAGAVSTLLGLPLRLRVLATSRSPLGVAGELVVDVPPLDVPASDDDASSALRLFLDRAADAADTSTWGTTERAAAADVCRALDGIPLALELAARRLRTLDPVELRDDLDAVLSEQVPAGEPRHRSLAAALEWSYRDLGDRERAAFRRLGLVHGRLPLAVAAEVVGDSAPVETLLRASLLTRSPAGVGMYEPVRQYALSLLEPDERAEGLARVAEAVASFTHRASPHLIGPDEIAWLDRMDALHGDLRATLDWALAHGRDDVVVQVPADLGYLWLLGWSPAEGRRWLDLALARVGDDRRRTQLLTWSSSLAQRMGDLELASRHGHAAVELARAGGDPLLLGRALHATALPEKYAADTTAARAHLREAHAVRLAGGDLGGAAMSLGAIADIDVNEGHFERAAEGYALGLPLMRSAATARGLVAYLHSMAELELMRGHAARAEELADEAWDLAVRTRDVWHVAQLRSVRAAAARDLGLPPQDQRERDRAALQAASAQTDPQVLLDVVEHVAGRLADDGRHAEALRLLTASANLRARDGILVSTPRRARRDADEARARRHVSPVDLDVEVDLGWLTATAATAVG